MRRRPTTEPDLPSIDEELRNPSPERYRSGLARLKAKQAQQLVEIDPERARAILELAHRWERSYRP